MSVWRVILPWLFPMAALVVMSAFFSGSEAALFSLRPRDRRALQRGSAAARSAVRLLENPERLLSAILFWNLLVNMLYFGIVSIVGARLEQDPEIGHTAAITFTIASLLTIIFFSEMLPKSIAVIAPVRLASIIGPILTVAVQMISPVLPAVSFVNLLARRLIWPGFQPEPDLDLSDIERAIDFGTEDAALAARERGMLQQLVQMTDTRVGEWMRPRSQLQLETLPARNKTGKPVPVPLPPSMPADGYRLFTEPGGEEVVSAVATRLLRPNQLDDISAVIEPVLYVPWSSNVATAFDQMLQQNRQVAAVVNEYGETIGILTQDDIVGQILSGEEHTRHAADGAGQAARQLAPGLWHASGSTSARWLAKRLDIPLPEGRTVTLAGLMQRLNERVPRLGDTCDWEGYRLTVIEDDQNGRLQIEVQHQSHQDAEPQAPPQ